ncbi:MAG TPA: RNA 3'-terminal phosphate cyclase [Bryobacteraceae bacterium]|nr:RNA 3'-terminal phosphate cyclase [Bryobacteraceae bacterium]
MLEIDGSFGEGGGQILRTSLALSLITQTPFRIVNIRRNRSKPGLRRQHLTAVRAAARIGNADLSGDALNSSELTFRPRPIEGGDYSFDIGSAGSTTLVFQTVLPALLLAPTPSLLSFVGGTHNHGGPPWDFLYRVFLPAIATMGAGVRIKLERHGFAPGGGGRWTARIEPSKLKQFTLHHRGQVLSRDVRVLIANLPKDIADRELKTVRQHLDWPRETMRSEGVEATGPGNIVLIATEYDHITELATGFGRKGVPAEKVASEAVECWLAYASTPAPVGEHLADQLLLPIAIAGSGSFTTVKPTRHTVTNAQVISKFLSVRFQLNTSDENTWTVGLE